MGSQVRDGRGVGADRHFVVSMSASAFPAGVDLVRAFFINVFMTAVFSALAYWWISRFEKRQARKSGGNEKKRAAAPGQPALIGMWQTGDGRPWSPVFVGRIRDRRANSFSFAVRMCVIV